MAQPSSVRPLGFAAAFAVVVANIVGTGVFTTLGYQVQATTDGFALLMMWVMGGCIALAGALSYDELAASIRGSGGEYRFLGRIYHPALGATAGWVSVAVGFAAPVALAAMALGRYAGPLVGVVPRTLALLVIIAVTGIHLLAPTTGGRVQVVVTALKVLLILTFIGAGFARGPKTPLSFLPTTESTDQIASGSFALSLILVSYAYSGFNAAAYFQGEVVNAERTIPRALVAGTVLVTLLYVALNWVFLRTTPIGDLAGQIEVGAIAAERIFGGAGGRLMSALIAALLVSTISAMTLAGPRVIEAMAEDLPPLRALAERSATGAPVRAVLLQAAPGKAFDCSGLVQWVMANFDVEMPRTSREQAKVGVEIPKDPSQLKLGDLLYFGNGRVVDHIGIYVGEGKYVHAARQGKGVVEAPLPTGRWATRWWKGVRRLFTHQETIDSLTLPTLTNSILQSRLSS